MRQVALAVAPHLQVAAQALVEDPEAVPPGGLGGVERLVGAAQHLGQARPVGVAQADADAEAARIEALERLDHRPDQRRRQIRGRPSRARIVGARAVGARGVGARVVQHRELVATEAGRHRSGRQGPAQALRHLDQHPVAGRVAVDVVDRLEAVEVEQHQAGCRAGKEDPRLRCLREAGPVHQAGEGVVGGAPAHLVGERACRRMRLLAGAGERRRLVLEPEGAAEVPLGLDGAAQERREVEQHRQREAGAVEAAGPGEAAGEGQERRRDEARRDRRIGHAVGDRAGGDAAEHDEVEQGLGCGVAVAQQRRQGPDEARQERRHGGEMQVPVDRAGGGPGEVRCRALLGGEAEAGRPAQAEPGEVDHRGEREPGEARRAEPGMGGDQRSGDAEQRIDRHGVLHAAAHRLELVAPDRGA